MKIGVQFFTLRKQCDTLENFSETLKRVADIGYTTVQISGVCPYEPEWLKAELDKNGLKCVLTHTKGDLMIADPIKVCNDHKVFGCRNIGLGSIPGGHVTEESYAQFVADFKPVAEVFKKEGHKLFYHNHQREFARSENGKLFMERFLDDFTPDLLGVTFDTYWAQVGGVNPAEWLEKLVGRVECIHLKDMKIIGKEQKMAYVGEGNLNFPKIIDTAEKVGVEYLLVEQDDCGEMDPFECVKRSYDYLTSLGLN